MESSRAEKLDKIRQIGETVSVEFKRCGGNIEHDVYETVCSFSNRFGGDIYLGILDDGTVNGVPEKAAPSMIKNFITVLANPALFSPTLTLDPEIITYEGKTLIHIHVPVSGDVISFKKVIYNRVNDSDVKVSSTSDIAQMYIRKQEIFTERKVYPYVHFEDLRLDLLPLVRTMAKNNSAGSHPWEKLNDKELLKSAGLYTEDRVTGEKGFNLAAVMLLGKDEVIRDVAPTYSTDALLRKVNVDRYDDRMYVENANRARKDGKITPENLEPYAKNPLIASFFRNIGYSDKLGSGVRKLFKYSYKYSGANPEFSEGDVFRITVPLNDEFSWDAQKNLTLKTEQVTEQVKRLVECLKPCPLSTKEILQELGLKHRPTLMNDYIKPALTLGLIEMTQPDSPKSPTQKYKVKL